ncbi:MAG: RidA family protein [Cyclobacteriaceae bacterium]|nr:RidA family protein [Cyclobacteriaceae bacterium SS2]
MLHSIQDEKSPIIRKLESLGIELPEPPLPGGNYSSLITRSNVAYIAIQFPISNGTFLYQGILGEELDTDDGYQAIRLCALNVLAQIDKYLDIQLIEGLNHIEIFYRGSDDWDSAPLVANGASNLFAEVLEDKGHHTRSIIGVKTLPRNFSVGLTATLTLRVSRSWIHY